MKYLNSIKCNKDFAKNSPSDILSKFIIFDGVIPDGVNEALEYNPIFKKERRDYVDSRDYLIQALHMERWKIRDIEDFYMRLKHDDVNMVFIRDNPELIPLIDCIELFDFDNHRDLPREDRIIETISFEEYVERFLD